ncbi:MAG: enoyl-CoA hydratase/isomerase family protein [Dethiobacter sp.]|nr:enoyl-CoA hydratase/isomerase family protein [Dethiobacter sp.]
MNSVLMQVNEGVALITLNRPEAFNAFNLELFKLLKETVTACFAPEIRAVVLTGAGKAFCSGGDLRAMSAAPKEDLPNLLRELTELFHSVITDLRLLPKPVIAAINGPAGGGGFSLALACDLRYAVPTARFKQAYTSAALCPDGGFSALLPAMIGFSRTSQLLFLDPVLDAQTAKEWGIVQDIFAEESFLAKISAIAARLANGPTLSFARAKAILNESLLPHLEKILELEQQGMVEAGQTEDALEGIEAFFAKRSPVYHAR